jgi:hypothetical protein
VLFLNPNVEATKILFFLKTTESRQNLFQFSGFFSKFYCFICSVKQKMNMRIQKIITEKEYNKQSPGKKGGESAVFAKDKELSVPASPQKERRNVTKVRK